MSAAETLAESLRTRGITDERVLAAIAAVDRERFVPPESAAYAWDDVALPIASGQTISQPYIVALMTEALALWGDETVLEIGTGSGYQTAILAKLAGEVYSIERVKPLLDEAWNRLMDMNVRNAHFRHGDGTLGWPEHVPFDRILIAAGAPVLPRQLLQTQLKDGGVAVLPVGPQDEQMLVEVRKRGDDLVSTDICPCRFVKLIGDEGWKKE